MPSKHSQPILTGKLRFVRRGDRHVLQQEWCDRGGAGNYEWRDVPLVEEEEAIGA